MYKTLYFFYFFLSKINVFLCLFFIKIIAIFLINLQATNMYMEKQNHEIFALFLSVTIVILCSIKQA